MTAYDILMCGREVATDARPRASFFPVRLSEFPELDLTIKHLDHSSNYLPRAEGRKVKFPRPCSGSFARI